MKKLFVSTMAVVALLGSTGCTKEEAKFGKEAFTYTSGESGSDLTNEIKYRIEDAGSCITIIKDEDGNYSKEYVSELVANSGENYDELDDMYIIQK